jgi:hypothetical protein
MMSGMPLETCWAFNKLWNNKFYYKVASRWLFLLIHSTMQGSMNIKFRRDYIIAINFRRSNINCSLHETWQFNKKLYLFYEDRPMLMTLSCEWSHFHTTFILTLYIFPRPVQWLEILLEIIFEYDSKWSIFMQIFFSFKNIKVTWGETGYVDWLFKHWGFISGQKSLTETTVVVGLLSRMRNLPLQPNIWSLQINMLLPKCHCLIFGCTSQELNLQQQHYKKSQTSLTERPCPMTQLQHQHHLWTVPCTIFILKHKHTYYSVNICTEKMVPFSTLSIF